MKTGRENHLSSARASISAARAAAFDILARVGTGSAHSDDLLHSARMTALSPEDRNLTTTLVMGTLRWQLQLDAALRPLLQRPDADLHPAALLALRMGLFQLLHLERIPHHAALNESVELAKANGAPHAAGMVNAVLRRVLRDSQQEQGRRRETLAVAVTSAEQAHPDWLLSRWRKHYGVVAARRIAEYNQAEPPRHALLLPDPLLPEIDDGSRLVAELASASMHQARRILDCCAAPGGKAAVLAARHPRADITATDISTKRLQAMRHRLDRSAVTGRVQTMQADMARTVPPALLDELFDLILCDVPCSGTGTLARNPEIRHRLRLSDLARHAERQRAILSNALRLLAPGGRLVYSTCSLEPEENQEVIEAILSVESEFFLVPALSMTGDIPGLIEADRIRLTHLAGGFLQTLPGIFPCDGFFAAVFERTASR